MVDFILGVFGVLLVLEAQWASSRSASIAFIVRSDLSTPSVQMLKSLVSTPSYARMYWTRSLLSADHDQRIDPANDENEMVTIACPDHPDGTALIFQVYKSILMRAPTFKRFFRSEHYLPGCEMHFTFMLDPGACVKIAMFYLTKGADIFSKQCLDISVDAYTDKLDRLQVLVRLYLLATSLELPVLANMAYEGLLDRERPMPAGYTISLASLIFSPKIGFDRRMRLWCMKHLAYYVQHLKNMPHWTHLLPSLDQDFRTHWDDLTSATNPRFSWPVDETKLPKELLVEEEPDSDEEIIRQLVRDTSMPGFNMHRPFSDTAAHRKHNSDEEWERRKSDLIGHYGGGGNEETATITTTTRPMTLHRSQSLRKAFSMLRFSPSKHRERCKAKNHQDQDHGDPSGSGMTWADRYTGQTSPEVAKAVAVLGMNELGGQIIAHAKPRRVSRILFKMNHL